LQKAIKSVADTEMQDKLQILFDKKENTARNLVVHQKMVNSMCKNKNDENRYMTAWNHVDKNVRDKDADAKLRHLIIDIYVGDSKLATPKIHDELKIAISALSNDSLKEELGVKMDKKKGIIEKVNKDRGSSI